MLLFSIEIYLGSLSDTFTDDDIQFTNDIEQPGQISTTEIPTSDTANSVSSGQAGGLPETVETELVEEINDFLENLQLPFISEESNRDIISLLQNRAATNIPAIEQDPLDFINALLDNVLILMLLLLPFLALIQKIVYLGSGRLYIEHLILTVHNHTFVFLSFILINLIGMLVDINIPFLSYAFGIVQNLLSLWLVIYLYLSYKRFFGQSHLLTFVKFSITSIAYSISMTTGILLFLILGFFTY